MTSRQRYKDYETSRGNGWFENTYYGSAVHPSVQQVSVPVFVEMRPGAVQVPVLIRADTDTPYIPPVRTIQQLVFNPITQRYEIVNMIVQ